MLSPLSLEYVRVPVSAVINGVAYDPHNDVIQMAFPNWRVDPVAGDWKAASWESDGAGGWVARCLVGPGGAVQLSPGGFDVWLKVIDSPEQLVRRVGMIEVG